MSDSLRPHELQPTQPPCPSPTPRVYPNSCPLSPWCYLIISSSVIPFSSCLQSFPTSGSFQMSQLFESGGQNIGVSASTSVLPMNTQDWFPLGWTGWISLHPIKLQLPCCKKGPWRDSMEREKPWDYLDREQNPNVPASQLRPASWRHTGGRQPHKKS